MPGSATLVRRAPGRDADLVSRLLGWYDGHARSLPWRGVRDPYAVWVSEVMLQQTRVETVRSYYLRWLARFPTVAALAAASEEEVLRLWSGLGYYSRARNLHRGAQVVVERFAGDLGSARRRLGEIPGIGPYTAGAIASIAFGERVPAVDGNVLRVLARLDADRGDVTAQATRRRLAERAAALVPAARPGDWNEALMDLGATICVPKAPRCGECPVRGFCQAFASGTADRIPIRAAKAAPRVERRHFALVRNAGRVLLVRERGRLLGGLWTLPGASTRAALERSLHGLCPGVRLGPALGRGEHRFTHRHWRMTVHGADAPNARDTADGGVRWFAEDELPGAALSVAQRKCLAMGGVPARPTPSGS